MTPMNAEITALVATWRKQADTHENYRHHLSDPYGDIGHVHEVKAKRLRMCADELERLAASRPAPAPSMPEPSPARAGYPYTEAGDRVMAERFPAPPVGEAERLLRDGDASRLRNIADAMAGRVDWEFWQDAMVDMRAIAHAIDQVAALASPAPQPADGVTQAQHEIVASIIDMVEHDQSRRAEMNRLRADALRAVLARALASPAPQPVAPAPVWHGCKAGGAVCARYKPTGIGCAEGECDLASGVWAASAPVEPPDWMSERQADWQHGAPVEPPPALDDNRCAVCGWPLDPNREFCSRGNCSQRPLPERCYDAARAVAEYEQVWRDTPSVTVARWREQPRLRGGGIISHAEIAEQEARKPTCRECGSDQMIYVDQYANGEQWRCRQCNVTAIHDARKAQE